MLKKPRWPPGRKSEPNRTLLTLVIVRQVGRVRLNVSRGFAFVSILPGDAATWTESPRSDTSVTACWIEVAAFFSLSQVNVCTDTCVFQQTWSSVQTCAGNGRT